MKTLNEAMEYVQRGAEYGVVCPCCDQFVKRYRRSVSSKTAQAMLELYAKQVKGNAFAYYRLHDVISDHDGGGDFAKLRFWQLVEEKEENENDTRTSGRWRVTDLGEKFALGQHKIRKFVVIQNNKILGFDGPYVDIWECLGRNRFSYAEIMKAVSNQGSLL